MGSVGKVAKKAVKIVDPATDIVKSGFDSVKGMINPKMPEMNAPEMEAPKPVAPATQKSANVTQAKDYARRKSASMSGRSSSNLLDTSEAKDDKEKDILG